MGRNERITWIRRGGKWAGVVLSVLLLSAWGLSYSWGVYAPPISRYLVFVERGFVRVTWSPNYRMIRARFELVRVPSGRVPRTEAWWLPRRTSKLLAPYEVWHALKLPLWIPCVVAIVPTIVLFWRDRRRRIPPGHCRRCSYDLTGNMSGMCPECGEPALVDRAPPAPVSHEATEDC